MKKNEENIFKPRARLLLQLGDQLIRNESIALLELIKNSYDADARNVEIKMRKVDNRDEGSIIIEDNGIGMDIDIIQNVWMEPGSDYKENLYNERKLTKKYKRLPLGEKGVGRFSVHKMGSVIELTSKTENGKEVYIRIDWDTFKGSRYLEDVPINISEKEKPEYFTGGKTGTKIVVKKLRNCWDKRMVRDVYRAVNSLCSPFDAPDSFYVDFDIDNKEWLKKLLSWKEIKEYSLFKFCSEIEGDEIKIFRYRFTPWPILNKLEARVVDELDPLVEKRKRMVDKENNSINLSSPQVGRIKFEALVFDRDSKLLELGVQDKKGLKEYLDSNGGIRVYRDGIRVYDYGEPGNDWLELGLRRVNIPTKRISNNLIIGAVQLQRDKSPGLIEKTNREGFIENDAYESLREAILYTLFVFETLRNPDKDRIRTFYGSTPSSEPVISSINELKDLVDKKIKDDALKNEVSNYLTRIENDYKTINETLLRSAGAGLSLSVAIHEIEKIISELIEAVKKSKPSERIIKLVKHLSQIIESYSSLVRKPGKKLQSLKDIIDQALFNMELRCEAHKIEIEKDFQHFPDRQAQIKCARNFVIGSIMNIIDNSIWWLDYGKVKQKRIYISISRELPGYLAIIIADNGPGFTLPTEEITKPFVSGKPDGMGLGLHITKEVMHMQKGKVLFPENDDFNLPEEFKKGAITVLALPVEEKK